MGHTAGPSPIVPCIIVGFLGMIIFWPTLLSIWESVESLLELVHHNSTPGYDSDGFGFGSGTLFLGLLFLVLYNLL
ncbi:hypothetical protein SDJN03_22551, partial [Cucurbita argyrosperma subsp. sororia]